MSWTNELLNVYDILCTEKDSGLLPLYHSTANAQIEVEINEKGEFINASQIDKNNAVTVIPVTEDSGSRSSGIAPMPFADKLIYIAGDYAKYADGKKTDNSEYFNAYMYMLKKWRDSGCSHRAVFAVYEYLEKAEIMTDLINRGILKTDESTGKLLPEKISGIDQCDCFVRFIVYYSDSSMNIKTYEDISLRESFISYNSSISGKKQLCYATGQMLPPTYKHPSKIRNSGDKAKLISSNDESGFTYRGRFADKEEALSVSYEFSQKLHNALKWLIAKHGIPIKGSMTLAVWSETLGYVPDITDIPEFEEEFFDTEDNDDYIALTADFDRRLSRYLFGSQTNFSENANIMLMALDAATTGRLSMSMYSEIKASEFYKNVGNWHSGIKWYCYNGIKKRNEIQSFSTASIACCAYGTEQNGKIECDDEFARDIILRLIPCITQGRMIPSDIMNALYRKASNPLAYEKEYNHRRVLETACGIIKKHYIDLYGQKGDVLMSYDPENTDRSYLFGCLLAIADKAESDTFANGDSRVTNARRYWSSFASRPYQTWGIIEEKLRPYMDRLSGAARINYEKRINEITSKMSAEEFSSVRRLEPMYLLGYHHYTAELYSKKNKEENNNESAE